MLESIRKDWQQFRDEAPGRRFRERYRRRQEQECGWLDPRRLFNVVVGLALVFGSAFFGWVPGPGILTFFLGLAMIASEFHPVARGLDWGEMKTRRLGRGCRDFWRKSSNPLRALIVVVALVCVGILLYGGYLVLLGA